MDGRARRVGVRFDELERETLREAAEQRQPVAERGGVDHQPVLVDQPLAR